MHCKSSLSSDEFIFIEKNGVKYIQFRNLKKYEDTLVHCFSTRIGGVSEGVCESLNLGNKIYDSNLNVKKNYRRLCGILGIEYNSLVFSNQVHGTAIKLVEDKDINKGIEYRTQLEPNDALATNFKGVSLVTFYADCVPILFYDNDKKVIAMAHSGWKGTLLEIGAKTIKKIVEAYGCKPKNIEIAIGPSIGKCCFEVGEEVYKQFIKQIKWSQDFCYKTTENKWHIDLKAIIKRSLLNSGIVGENICTAEICTKCNNHIFFSHRGDKGKTGSLAAIMQLK